jgi:hypothetical protein
VAVETILPQRTEFRSTGDMEKCKHVICSNISFEVAVEVLFRLECSDPKYFVVTRLEQDYLKEEKYREIYF